MSPRLTLVSAAVVALLLAAAVIYWKGLHAGAARERPRTAAALAQAAAAGLEAQGERENAGRVDVAARQRAAAARTISEVATNALQSEDAHALLDAERTARLRAADRGLCLADVELAGCAADRNAP